MRKFYLFMAAVFCAATTFTGCSDDDGGNDGSGGNGQGAGNGGSGVVVLAKKVAKVSVLNDEGEVSETYLFNYDQEGRVSKIINQYGPGGGYQEEKTFSYGDNKITITEDDEESVITLKDGKAVSYTEKDGNYEDTYSFTYSGNYLYQVENVEKHLSNGNWSVDYESKTTYNVKNGNLSSVKNVWKEEEEEAETATGFFQYGNVANNANIDLGFICYDMDAAELHVLCVLGARYQNLPASMSSRDGGWTYDVNYSYVVDKDNYVTKITMVSVEAGEGKSYRETAVYEIVYAEN